MGEEERHELRQRLEEVLCITDIRRLPAPKCPWATTLVQAHEDAYIDPSSQALLRRRCVFVCECAGVRVCVCVSVCACGRARACMCDVSCAPPLPTAATTPPAIKISELITPRSWHDRWRQDATLLSRVPSNTSRTKGVGGGEGAGSSTGKHEGMDEFGGKHEGMDEFGVETAWVPGGHVTSFFFQHATFRSKIVAALSRLQQ